MKMLYSHYFSPRRTHLRAFVALFASLLFLSPLALADSNFPLEKEEIRQAPSTPPAVDLTVPTDDLWVRVRNGFSMPNLNDELVLKHQQYYQSRPEYLQRMVARSSRYMHHIVEELERRGMPTELALLPMVESSYNPMAYSSAHASGLWQFIPSTGKHFNLQQNWWHDQRRDIVASTSAALDYLQYVYELHGDWHLALASYNWGEGAVGRAIAKNEAKGLLTDYSSLTMPPETRNYVPKLQALKNIFSNPWLVAELKLPPVPNEPYFRTVVTSSPIDIKLAAQFSGMKTEEFAALNPAHNRPVIPAETALVIPADRVDTFNAEVAAHDAPLSNWQTYELQSGEKLEDVAPRFGISLADLRRINGLDRKARITSGQTLLVPGEGSGTLDLDAFPATASIPSTQQRTTTKTHTVKKGETLQAIARKYNVDVSDLKRLNKLKSNQIAAGKKLTLIATVSEISKAKAEKPQKAETQKTQQATRKSPATKITRHKIQKGDTLFAIAKRYKVDQDDIKRWNKLAGSHLKVGSTITIQLDS